MRNEKKENILVFHPRINRQRCLWEDVASVKTCAAISRPPFVLTETFVSATGKNKTVWRSNRSFQMGRKNHMLFIYL